MSNKMLMIDNEAYYFDIDAIMKWCLASTNNPFKETEINEGYDTNEEGDIQMMTKVVRELKTNNVQDDTVRYDFIKFLIAPFLGEIGNKEEVENNFSYSLLYNTLIKMGFLIKIKED